MIDGGVKGAFGGWGWGEEGPELHPCGGRLGGCMVGWVVEYFGLRLLISNNVGWSIYIHNSNQRVTVGVAVSRPRARTPQRETIYYCSAAVRTSPTVRLSSHVAGFAVPLLALAQPYCHISTRRDIRLFYAGMTSLNFVSSLLRKRDSSSCTCYGLTEDYHRPVYA